MSEPSIPAWKRAGLKHSSNAAKKSQAAYDPLKEGLKRATESSKNRVVKQPKRPKLAKSERPRATHEIDQLAYLRQYSEDKPNWKFSKQKQNWILKHLFTDIDDDQYEQPLLNYLEGLKGSARNWIIEDSMDVVTRWNEFMTVDSKQQEEGPKDEHEEKSSSPISTNAASFEHANQPTESKDKVDNKQKEPSEKPALNVPHRKMALRAQKIVALLEGNSPNLILLDKPST